jgi:hypothetical protein
MLRVACENKKRELDLPIKLWGMKIFLLNGNVSCGMTVTSSSCSLLDRYYVVGLFG